MRRALSRRIVCFSFIPLLILVALVAVLGSSDNTSQAVYGGEGPLGPPIVHPNTGTTLGANLCQVGFTTTGGFPSPTTPDADYWDIGPGGTGIGDRDFTGACDNNTTNAPGANSVYYTDMSIPAPSSGFTSNINASPPGATIAPGPGNPAFNPASDPPLGAVIGATFSAPTFLALRIGAGAGSPCNNFLQPEFTYLNATVDFQTFAQFGFGGDLDKVTETATTALEDTLFTGAPALVGSTILMTSGAANGESRTITAHAGTTITVANFTATPSQGNTYVIDAGNITAAGTDTITVTDTTGMALGRGLKITGGKGAGQGRYIKDITASPIIKVDRPWEAAPDSTSTYEITNQVYPRTPGISNHTRPLSEDDPGNPGLPLHATRFPSYLLELIDPDLVHARMVNNDVTPSVVHNEYQKGTAPPLTLRARYSARALISGDDIELEFMVFEVGSAQAFQALENHPWAQFASHWGYITMTVLIDVTVPPSPSAIQDFCSPLGTVTTLLGHALENQWAASPSAGCTALGFPATLTDVDDNGVDLSCPNTPATDGSNVVCITGTLDAVTVGATTQLTDTLFTGDLTGQTINMTSGAASGESRVITAHAGTIITVANFSAAPAAGDSYDVECGPRYTLPASGTGILGGNTHLYLSMTRGYRDADDDGIEGYLDSCEGSADTWDDQYGGIGGPRVPDQNNTDNLWDDDNDGLNRSCDLDESVATGSDPNEDKVLHVTAGTATGFTDFTLIDTSRSWAVDEHAGRSVEVKVPNQTRLINSNTSDTLTLSQSWAQPANPAPLVSYDIINEQFANRQDNCPNNPNPSQFESEQVPEVGGQPDYPEDGGHRIDIMGDVCETNDYVGDGHYHEDLNFYPHCISANQAVDDPDGDHWCNAEENAFGSCPSDGPPNCEAQGFPPGTLAAKSTPEHIYLDTLYGLVRQQAGARPYVDRAINAALLGQDITGANNPHPESGEPVSGISRPCSNGFDDDADGNVDRNQANCRSAALAGAMTTSLDALLPDDDNDGEPTWKEIMRETDPYERCPSAGSDDELLDPWTLDLNDDKFVNVFDVFKMYPTWLKSESQNEFTYRGDLNWDGSVNVMDVFLMYPFWLGGTPGAWACP